LFFVVIVLALVALLILPLFPYLGLLVLLLLPLVVVMGLGILAQRRFFPTHKQKKAKRALKEAKLLPDRDKSLERAIALDKIYSTEYANEMAKKLLTSREKAEDRTTTFGEPHFKRHRDEILLDLEKLRAGG